MGKYGIVINDSEGNEVEILAENTDAGVRTMKYIEDAMEKAEELQCLQEMYERLDAKYKQLEIKYKALQKQQKAGRACQVKVAEKSKGIKKL
jgi:hypothetical protein